MGVASDVLERIREARAVAEAFESEQGVVEGDGVVVVLQRAEIRCAVTHRRRILMRISKQ